MLGFICLDLLVNGEATLLRFLHTLPNAVLASKSYGKYCVLKANCADEANNLVKVIIAGAQLVGRAFTRAVRREWNASKQAAEKAGGGEKGAKSAASSSLFGMSLEEAKQILNVTDAVDAERVAKNYEHLMKANEKSTGGSFYLQSKVYRAKERIDAESQSDKSAPTSEDKTPGV